MVFIYCIITVLTFQNNFEMVTTPKNTARRSPRTKKSPTRNRWGRVPSLQTCAYEEMSPKMRKVLNDRLPHIGQNAKTYRQKERNYHSLKMSKRLTQSVRAKPWKYAVPNRIERGHPCTTPKASRLTKPAIIRCFREQVGFIDRPQTARDFGGRFFSNRHLRTAQLSQAPMKKIMMVFTQDQLAELLNMEVHGHRNW